MADGSSASAKAGEIVAKLRDAAQKVLTKNSDTGNYVILDEAKEKYQVLAARSSNLSRDVRDQYQALALRGSTLSRDVLGKTGITPEDLSKVHRVPAFVALAAIFINLLLIFSRYNTGWVKGFMKINGKVYEAYVSLMAVELGEGGADTWRFHEEMGVDCGTSDSEYCMLSSLCEASLPEGADPSAYTPTEAWCALEEAGKLAQTLLWLGFIPGIGTMFLTLLFAAKEIGKVGTYLSKAEKQGISMTIQKYAISACWVGLWAFLFISMVAYAAEVPDGLGVGLISLEASFGVVRLSFLLVSIFGSLLIVSLFDMWRADGFIEAWMEFAETPLCSVKKALYLELMLQMCCYLLMFIDKVQWELLLVVICVYYVDAKVRNFMLMYVVLSSASILFDLVELCFMPQDWENYTPGQTFTHGLFMTVLTLKILILGTIYLYEKEMKAQGGAWRSFHPDDIEGREDEIAE